MSIISMKNVKIDLSSYISVDLSCCEIHIYSNIIYECI